MTQVIRIDDSCSLINGNHNGFFKIGSNVKKYCNNNKY